MQSGEVINILKSDDVNSLKDICPSKIGVYSFPDVSGERDEILRNQPPLVSLAVYFSAVECIKYLVSMDAKFDDTDDFGVSFSFIENQFIFCSIMKKLMICIIF